MSWFHWEKMGGHRIRQISYNWSIVWAWCCQKYMPKPSNIAELKTALLLIWNDLPQEFIDKEILSFQKRLQSCCCSWWTFWTQFNYREGNWHSSLEYLNCWRKSCAKFDSILLNIQDTAVLNFKMLYLLNHVCYFNKICRIFGLNPHL